MNIQLIEKTLFGEMKEAVNDYKSGNPIDFIPLNHSVEELIHGAESCKEMINNRGEISDSDFYRMLNEFSFMHFGERDYYNVLELVYHTNFVDDTVMKTDMHKIIQKRDNGIWWEYRTDYHFRVLYAEDFKVDSNHSYTIEEIKQLIEEKKIVLLSKVRVLSCTDVDYKKEEFGNSTDLILHENYEKFDCAFHGNREYEFFHVDGKYYPYTLKYIKNYINSKKLKRLFSAHINHTENEVRDVTDYRGNDAWSYVAKEYSKEFEDKGYAKRLVKLREVEKSTN